MSNCLITCTSSMVVWNPFMSAIFQVSEVLAGSFWPTCFEKTLAKKEQILLYVHQSSISTIIVQIRQKKDKTGAQSILSKKQCRNQIFFFFFLHHACKSLWYYSRVHSLKRFFNLSLIIAVWYWSLKTLKISQSSMAAYITHLTAPGNSWSKFKWWIISNTVSKEVEKKCTVKNNSKACNI